MNGRPIYEIAVLLLLVVGIGIILIQQLGITFCPS